MNKSSNKIWPPGFSILERGICAPPEMVAAFAKVPSAIVSDCLGRSVGGIGLRALHGNLAMCGSAITVRVRPGDNLMIHKALEIAGAGDVLVVDGSGDLTQALVGGLMRATMMKRQLAGLVVNGVIRDLVEWQEGTFPVFALGNVHRGPTKEGPGEINVPVSCAGLMVSPGDLVIGDPDGVVAIKPSDLNRLLPLVRGKIESEDKLRAQISSGTVPAGRFDDILRSKGCPI